MISARCFAPAIVHTRPSSSILWTRSRGIEDLLLKTLAFLSFQIFQEINIMAVRKPLGEEVGVWVRACQYSSTVGRTEPKLSMRCGHESHEVEASQILLE
jgi:hypothetical protein